MKPVLLNRDLAFPDPRGISSNVSGLVAIGGDLSVERLLAAYGSGIFPWSAQPITWWSPDPRAIFEFDRFHISKGLAKIVKRSLLGELPPAKTTSHFSIVPMFHVTINQAFAEVIHGCATAREEGNWISPPFIDAYIRLHEAGHVHSVECWRDGVLAGGIYGVAIGGFFAGESMFHRVSNASKVALCFLFEHLRKQGFTFFDIQMLTPTTEQFGAVMISREEYLRRLALAIEAPVAF